MGRARNLDAGVESSASSGGRVALVAANRRFSVDDLAVQITKLHTVPVHDAQLPYQHPEYQAPHSLCPRCPASLPAPGLLSSAQSRSTIPSLSTITRITKFRTVLVHDAQPPYHHHDSHSSHQQSCPHCPTQKIERAYRALADGIPISAIAEKPHMTDHRHAQCSFPNSLLDGAKAEATSRGAPGRCHLTKYNAAQAPAHTGGHALVAQVHAGLRTCCD